MSWFDIITSLMLILPVSFYVVRLSILEFCELKNSRKLFHTTVKQLPPSIEDKHKTIENYKTYGWMED